MVDPEELMEKALEKAKKSKEKDRKKTREEGKQVEKPTEKLDYLICGWGVQPDQYVFARIIAWSLNQREIFCRLAKKEKSTLGHKNYKFVPGEIYGDTFKLYKSRTKEGELSFKGRYPYETGRKKDGMRKGTFHPYSKEKQSKKK